MQHGYEAIGGGKTFHQSQNEAASWHYYNSFRGFLWASGYPVNELDRGGFDWGTLDVDDEETTDTQLANWAADYLSRDHPRPFFLACGFYRPHLPFYAPRKYFEKFPRGRDRAAALARTTTSTTCRRPRPRSAAWRTTSW